MRRILRTCQPGNALPSPRHPLRLTGRGAVGPRGGPAGDLYVHIKVDAHDRFRRQGYDLVDELHLSMAQAALGAHLTYETLDGEVRVWKVADGSLVTTARSPPG